MRCAFRAGCVVVALASVASSFGQSLNVEDAVRLGLAQNPQVKGGQAGVLAAKSNYLSTASFPPLNFSASHVHEIARPVALSGGNNDTVLDVGDTLDLSGQRRYSAAGLNATYRSTLYQYRESLLSLEQQIRDAYWSLAAVQAEVRYSATSLKEAQRIYDLTVKQENAGASPKGDVIRSSIDVANAKQSYLAAEGAAKTALIAFNTLLGRPPTTPIELTEEFTAPPALTLPKLNEITEAAQKTRPLLVASKEDVKAADYAVRQAEASRWPDLGVDYQRSFNDNFYAVQFGLSFPIFDFGSIRHAVKAAKQTKKQVEAQQETNRQQVDQQVAQAHADLETALKSAESFKNEILDPSQTLLQLAQLGYEKGGTGILPIIDAESTIRDARVGYINALLAIYKAQDEVIAATGIGATSLQAAKP